MNYIQLNSHLMKYSMPLSSSITNCRKTKETALCQIALVYCMSKCPGFSYVKLSGFLIGQNVLLPCKSNFRGFPECPGFPYVKMFDFFVRQNVQVSCLSKCPGFPYVKLSEFPVCQNVLVPHTFQNVLVPRTSNCSGFSCVKMSRFFVCQIVWIFHVSKCFISP